MARLGTWHPADASLSDNEWLAAPRASDEAAWQHEFGVEHDPTGLTRYRDMVPRFDELALAADLRHLPLTHRHGLRAGSYPNEHRDPFDRMLAAQAELESLTLVTRDDVFQDFPVQVLW